MPYLKLFPFAGGDTAFLMHIPLKNLPVYTLALNQLHILNLSRLLLI
jgi:hypothetical protein